jgi:hypothetical protein
MTRVSVTNDGAAVVVVEVLVDVVDVVVDGGVEVVVVDGVGIVDDVATSDVAIAVGVGALVADEEPSEPDEQANITCDATISAHHRARLVIVFGCSTRGDQNAAITVGELLTLDHAADLCQELRDAAHHAVLRPDLGADPFELRTSHQFRGRIDR